MCKNTYNNTKLLFDFFILITLKDFEIIGLSKFPMNSKKNVPDNKHTN